MSVSTHAHGLMSYSAESQSPSITADVHSQYLENESLFCDWTLSATRCSDPEFTRDVLLVSTMLHVLLGIFGIWIAVYRNEGFSRKIVTKLFTIVESGIQPKPVDCVVFFMTIASFSKVPANVLLMLDSLSTTKWVRIAFEQVYWIALVVACTSYFIGLLNAMPVTKRDGIWAIYEPEYAPGYGTQDAVHVLYPNTYSKNVILVASFIIPVVCCTGPAIASGVLYDHGSFRASRALLVVRHTGWGVVLYSMALICLYYGLKCTLILRANTIVSKTVLKAPEATFGTSCSKAISHARYLFVMLQITGAGGAFAFTLGGSGAMVFVFFRDDILAAESGAWAHFWSVMWTCGTALAIFIKLTLVGVQSLRHRRPYQTSTTEQ